jgi:hypothetical protein
LAEPLPIAVENVVVLSAWNPDALPLPIAGANPDIVEPTTVAGMFGDSKVHEAIVAA